jgi:hypothetical protein
VYKKFLWLSENAKIHHHQQVLTFQELQFDEMHSLEHTKLKPLTIALAVSETYQILGVSVGEIPSPLRRQFSLLKYGPRKNESLQMINSLLSQIKLQVKNSDFILKSDLKPGYDSVARQVFPRHSHQQFLAKMNKEKRREMKYENKEKKIFDPLFAINQRCAKLRADIRRLTRRSWCTTKKKENLEKHLFLYIAHNNRYKFIS